MAEQRLLSVNVECYAGHRGEQTPRTLTLGDRRIAVAEVLYARGCRTLQAGHMTAARENIRGDEAADH